MITIVIHIVYIIFGLYITN